MEKQGRRKDKRVENKERKIEKTKKNTRKQQCFFYVVTIPVIYRRPSLHISGLTANEFYYKAIFTTFSISAVK
jgi:hypothetical protein